MVEVAVVERGGTVESAHCGTVVALDADGSRVLSVGDVDSPMFPRSSLKPIQALGMLRAGLRAPDAELLAIAQASHSGEPVHLEAVRRLLHSAGRSEADLRCPADLPMNTAAMQDWVRAGQKPSPVAHNCSGKHAAMIATCAAAGWPVETYLDSGHPLQQQLRHTVEEVCGAPVTAVVVDGCGAPLFAVPLVALARGVAALVQAAEGTPERSVVDAGREHPLLMGGTGRDVTELMQGVPGLYAKDGAEGVYVAATSHGAAVALKITDGSARARVPVLLEALRSIGTQVEPGPFAVPVLGGGRAVGHVRARELIAR